MKRWIAVLAATSVASVVGTTAPATGAGTSPCRSRWGSLTEQSGALAAGAVTGVRAGSHACFDRLVVDLTGRPGGYRVQYVNQVLLDASGQVVALRGGARLQVVVLVPGRQPAMPSTAGMRTFRQVAWAGSFEGQSSLGLGVRARLPFRVFVLAGSHPRLVVDVAHHW